MSGSSLYEIVEKIRSEHHSGRYSLFDVALDEDQHGASRWVMKKFFTPPRTPKGYRKALRKYWGPVQDREYMMSKGYSKALLDRLYLNVVSDSERELVAEYNKRWIERARELFARPYIQKKMIEKFYLLREEREKGKKNV